MAKYMFFIFTAIAMMAGISYMAKQGTDSLYAKKNAMHSERGKEATKQNTVPAKTTDSDMNLQERKEGCAMKMKTPSGHVICLETAITPAEREKGLMFRKSLDKDKGMMFFFEDDTTKGFWMKNTLIPLDIIFLDENYVVLKVFENVRPSYEGAPENEIARATWYGRNVLELAGGMATEYGLRFGTKLEKMEN